MEHDILPYFSGRESNSNRFRFVSGLDRSYSKTIRAHVLRKHMLERSRRSAKNNPRRKREPKLSPDSLAQQTPFPTLPVEGEWNVILQPGFDAVEFFGKLTFAKDPNLTSSLSHPDGLNQSESDNFTLTRTMVSPLMPFAISINAKERYFLEYAVDASWAYWGVSPRIRMYPPRDFTLPYVLENDLCTTAMITYGAEGFYNETNHLASEAIGYRLTTTKMINKYISDPLKSSSDPVLMAIIILLEMKLELISLKRKALSVEEIKEIGIHINGLRSLIIARGGFEEIAKIPTLGWDLHWADIVSGGNVSTGLTPLSPFAFHSPAKSNPHSISTSSHAIILTPAKDDFLSFSEELIGAYAAFYKNSRRIHSMIRSSQHPTLYTSNTYPSSIMGTFFHAKSPLNRLMTDKSCTRAMSRLALPLYWNISLYDFKDKNPIELHNFITYIHTMMVEGGLDTDGTTEALLWLMMTAENERLIYNPPSIWLLARLLYICNRLSNPLQKRLEDVLIGFLIPNMEYQPVIWSPEEFRQDVLCDLGFLDYYY